MRIQKQRTRSAGSRTYYKYVIVIPPKLINKLGWKQGENLNATVKKRKLIIRGTR